MAQFRAVAHVRETNGVLMEPITAKDHPPLVLRIAREWAQENALVLDEIHRLFVGDADVDEPDRWITVWSRSYAPSA